MMFDRLMDEIGEKILSAPAVTERVRKMEEAGIITGYHARVYREKEAPGVTKNYSRLISGQAGLYFL